MNALQQEIAAAVRAVIREELRAALAEEREPPPPYLTVGEAAKAMKVHPRTVRRWVDEGSIESRRIGSKLMIPREAVR